MADGSLVLIENNHYVDVENLYISVDVNGYNKKPNRLGQDLFMFQLDKNGHVLPMGTKATTYYSENDSSFLSDGPLPRAPARSDGRSTPSSAARRRAQTPPGRTAEDGESHAPEHDPSYSEYPDSRPESECSSRFPGSPPSLPASPEGPQVP